MRGGSQVPAAIARYLLRVVVLLLAASLLTFVLMILSPIDPIQQYVLRSGNGASAEQREALAQYWGLGDPPVKRYLSWLGALMRGDLGTSLVFRVPVAHVIGQRFLNTFALMATAWLLAGVLGYCLGLLMGVRRGSILDRVLKRICLMLYSTPTFWLGMMLLMLFAVWLGWFPIGFSSPVGVVSADVTIGQRIHHLALPALTLSLMPAVVVALHTRQKVVDVMESEYVLFARARGSSTGVILRRHGIRNTLLPMVTLQFASFGELFGGSILAETVFSYPGLGSAIATAGLNSDLPLLLGITLFSTLFVMIGNATANLIYGFVDPRIREEHVGV